MYSPMNGSSGHGFPPQYIAHFPSVAPGSPAGPIVAIPARSLPAPPEESEDKSKPTETEILNRILSVTSKLSHQVKSQGKALREITSRQCAIEDRLSLMEQSVLRVDTRAVEILDQGAEVNETVKKTGADLGGIKDEVQQIRTISSRSKDDVQEVKTLSRSNKDDIQEIKSLSRNSKEDIQDIKSLSSCNKDDIQDIKTLSKGIKDEVQELKTSSASATSGRADLGRLVGERIDSGSEKCMNEVATLAGQIKELKQLIEEAAVKVDKYCSLVDQGLIPHADKMSQDDAPHLAASTVVVCLTQLRCLAVKLKCVVGVAWFCFMTGIMSLPVIIRALGRSGRVFATVFPSNQSLI